MLFVVLRPARYVDREEVVEIGEVHLFLGPDFVITVRHAAEPDLGEVRTRLEADPELLRQGPNAVLYAVLDKVVDDYGPVLDGLQNDIDEIEVQVFGGDPKVVPAHLPALPRGDRLPARGRPARRPPRRACAPRSSNAARAPTSSCGATCATSPTTPPA